MNMLARKPAFLESLDCYCRLEDFDKDQTDLDWIDTITDSGSVAVGDAANGIATLTPSDGTVADNDEAYYATSNELFLPVNGKPFIIGGYVKFTEANTDDANVGFGVANAVAANLLIDDGGGIRASGTLAAIYKVDGTTAWRCTSRNQSTVTISTSNQSSTSTGYQYLEIEFMEFDSTSCKICFRHGTNPNDAKPLIDSTTLKPIVHEMLYASATEMQAFFAVKNGDTNLETLLADFCWWSKKR